MYKFIHSCRFFKYGGEPAMIIVMAVIVGMIMIAVMLPLLNMYAEIEASGTM